MIIQKKKARKSQRAEDWIYYKAVRKQCSKETLKAKNDYVNEKVMDDLEHGNTKPFWRFIKHLQFDIISIPPIRHAGQLLTNSIEKLTQASGPDHYLLTSLQHGFRRRHSCETQLLLSYDDLIGSFDPD